jgi:hypothetical protein
MERMPSTEDRSGLFDGDQGERLVAFKTWRILDGVLQSRYVPVSWVGPVLAADCYREMPTTFRSTSPHVDAPHDPPHPSCSCGIHAEMTPDLRAPKVDFRAVTGIVLLWGGVQTAGGGLLRSGAARVCALGLYPHAGRRQQAAVRAVAASMEADVVDTRELQLAAERYAAVLAARLPAAV